MDSHSEDVPTIIQAETTESPVSILYAPRRVTVYRLFEMELDRLSSAQNSLHVAFFGVAFGTALSLGITLSTVEISRPRVLAAYWGIFICSTVLAIYFFVRGLLDWRASRQQIRTIKEQRKDQAALSAVSSLYSRFEEANNLTNVSRNK
jgi:hypothetical protein